MQKAKIFNEPYPTSSVTLYYMLLYLMKMYIIDQDEEQYSILYSLSDNSQ